MTGFARPLVSIVIFMKKTILRMIKKLLPILTIALYLVNLSEALKYVVPSPPSTTAFSMMLSILFFISYGSLLWMFRKSRKLLIVSLMISIVSAFAVVYAWVPAVASSLPQVVMLDFIVIVPFYGLTFFPFVQNGGSAWVLTVVVSLLFLFKVTLLVLGILEKRRKNKPEAGSR